jgi:hypothetical protein
MRRLVPYGGVVIIVHALAVVWHLLVLAEVPPALTVQQVGWVNTHVVAMGLSYIVMLTAFYVDEGETLPLGKKFSHVSYWILPSLIGMPFIARALARNRKLRRFDGSQ